LRHECIPFHLTEKVVRYLDALLKFENNLYPLFKDFFVKYLMLF
jgi:hypothetical protein